MIKTDNECEFVYDSYMPPHIESSLPESLDMNPHQAPPELGGESSMPPIYYRLQNREQLLRQELNMLRLKQEQRRRQQFEETVRQQQLMRHRELMMRQQQQQQQAYRPIANLPPPPPNFLQPNAPAMRIPISVNTHRMPFREQPRPPIVYLEKRGPPNWVVPHTHIQPMPLPLPARNPPLLVPLDNEPSPPTPDNLKDWDATDFLRLSLGDDNDDFTRKRKQPPFFEMPAKRIRRTRAELTAVRNASLLKQCKECSVTCERMETPRHVRIFGNSIFRGDMPNVPTMKLSPKTIDFLRIRTIGYMVTKRGVCFSCLGDSCKYKSYEEEKFKEHLNRFHRSEASASTQGFCELCRKHCCGYNVMDEFLHLIMCHTRCVDRHPMHQVLLSRAKPASLADDVIVLNDSLSSSEITLLEEMTRAFEAEEGTKNDPFLTIDFNDDDYHPSSSDDEEEEEEEEEEHEALEAEEVIPESVPSEESEIDSTPSTSEEEEDEEELHLTSDEEHRKRKVRNRSTSSDIEEIPQYMLERIKHNASVRSSDAENFSTHIDTSVSEAIEDLIKQETPKGHKKHRKKKKKKQKEKNYASKSTSMCEMSQKTYTISSASELPSCKVVLKRCDTDGIKVVIKRTDKEKIAVPDIPTPPSSEDSRDSLPTPPLNNPRAGSAAEAFAVKREESDKENEEEEADNGCGNSMEQLNQKESEGAKGSLKTPTKTQMAQLACGTSMILDESRTSDKHVQNIIDASDKAETSDSAELICSDEPTKELNDSQADKAFDMTDDLFLEADSADVSGEPSRGYIESSFHSNLTRKPLRTEELHKQENSSELVDLSCLYPWIDSSISGSVHKSKACFDVLRNEFCQFSTYKCMFTTCSYFTTDFQKFETHTLKHTGEHFFCSFCLFDAASSEHLCDHVEKLHKHDRYQCNCCMYRASEKAYVALHLERFHAGQRGKILKSPVQALMKSARSRIHYRLKNVNLPKVVQAYECKIAGCNENFFCKDSYRKHLAEKLDKANMEQYCEVIFTEVAKLDEQQLGVNQCLHCTYSSDSLDEIKEHMADFHPHKLGFICKRKSTPDDSPEAAETLENTTEIEYIGHSSFKVKLFTDDKAKLTKSDESTSDNLQDTPLPDQNEQQQAPTIEKITHFDST